MKLSITIQTPEVPKLVPVALLSGSLDEKIAKAASYGAHGVEILTTNPRELDLTEIQSSLHKHNMEAAAIASGGMAYTLGLTLLNPEPLKSLEAIERLFDLIDFAAGLHAPVVTIGSFRGRSAMVDGNGKKCLKEILIKAGAYAQDRSVRLALEAINRFEADFLLNAAEVLDFLADVDQPSVGVLLDTFHVNIEESSWTEPFWRASKNGKLFHVHLGDNNRLPPGRGLIDFSAIINTLDQVGYQGYVSAELLAKPDPDTAAEQTTAYILPILARIESRSEKPE